MNNKTDPHGQYNGDVNGNGYPSAPASVMRLEPPPPSCGFKAIKICLLVCLALAVIFLAIAFAIFVLAFAFICSLDFDNMNNSTMAINGTAINGTGFMQVEGTWATKVDLFNREGSDSKGSKGSFVLVGLFLIGIIAGHCAVNAFEFYAVYKENFKLLLISIAIELVLMVITLIVLLVSNVGFKGSNFNYVLVGLLIVFACMVRQRDNQRKEGFHANGNYPA